MQLNPAYIFLFTFLICSSCATQAQVIATGQATDDMLELEELELPNGDIDFYARNKGVIPITLTIDFEKLKNMAPSVKMPFTKVLQPSDEKTFLFKMKRRSKNAEANYGFMYGFSLGDATIAAHDDQVIYLLPYLPGTKQLMGQGNNGRFSHKGINAVDFNMEEGTKICAARSGTVVAVKSDSDTGCKSSRCKDQANFILVYHEDGSFGHYGHIQHNGVLVKVGDKIRAGQVIGKSGNTGWSSGPHLHFEVYIQKNNQVTTYPVKFAVSNGKASYLEEGKFYKAVH